MKHNETLFVQLIYAYTSKKGFSIQVNIVLWNEQRRGKLLSLCLEEVSHRDNQE
jgi:hypothetical protein